MKSLFATTAGLLLCCSSHASLVYHSGFEAPDYAPGHLAGQDGWAVFNNGTPGTAAVQTGNVASGLQAAQLSPGSAQAGLIHGLSAAGNLAEVSFGVDLYLASSTAQSQWQVGLYNGYGGFNVLADDGVQFAAVGYPQLAAGTFLRDVWHHVLVDYDLLNATFDVFVDSIAIGTGLQMFPPLDLQFLTVNSFGGPQADDKAFLDNVSLSVTSVPEPGSLALVALALALALGLGLGTPGRRRTIRQSSVCTSVAAVGMIEPVHSSTHRRLRMKHLNPFAATGLMLASLTGAQAASLGIGASAGVNAVYPGDSHSYSTFDPAQVASLHTVSSSITGYGSASSGSMTGMAGHFSMQAYSLAVDPVANGCLNCGTLVSQQTDSGGFTDSLLVGSATLAAGTPVDLLFTMTLLHTFSASQALSNYLTAGYQAQLTANDANQGVSLFTDGAGGYPDVFSIVLHSAIGHTVNLNSSTQIGTYAEYIDQTARSVSEQVDLDLYVDAINAGVTLSSASGHDYAAPPVPEPAVWLMLGLGLPLLALRRGASLQQAGGAAA